MSSTDPDIWTPPPHWAAAAIATALQGEIVDDPQEVALSGFGQSALLVLAIVAHLHGASVRDIHMLSSRSRWTVRRALRHLDRAGLVERDRRTSADHWIATAEGTRLGVIPYATRLLRSAQVSGGSVFLPTALRRVGTVRGPRIFSPALRLAEVTDPELLGEVIRTGKHDDQVYALTRLLTLSDPRSAAILIEVTQRRGDDELDLARKAVVALGNVNSHDVIVALIEIAANRDSVMREAAARSLGRLGARDAQDVLVELLSYPSEPVRVAALQALHRIPTHGTSDQIAVALSDPNRRVRRYARHLLIRLGAADQLRLAPRRIWVSRQIDVTRARRAGAGRRE